MNPIIFARSETTHIPVSLEKATIYSPLNDAIYSAEGDGSLKLTPLPTIGEEKEEKKTGPLIPKLSVLLILYSHV